MPTDALPVELNWQVGARTGWQLFGQHLALGLARAGRRVYLAADLDPTGIAPTVLPALLAMRAPGDPTERRIRLEGLGNHFPAPDPVADRLQVALAIFEDTHLSPDALARTKRFAHHIACSTWAQEQLATHGITAHRWFQGYDESLFHPAPRLRPDDGRFLIFSGGKLEFRKGQDLVIAAFRRFLETPDGKDAILVTAWQNRWPQTMDGIWASGHVTGIPVTRNGHQDITAWLGANGIPAAAHLDVGMPAQYALAPLIRECDVALFPNRCEGATNMMLPEVMACGVPVIAAHNTGHRDSGPAPYAIPLTHQSPVTLRTGLFTGYDGWGESDVDEMVVALQAVRRSPVPLEDPPRFARETFGWHPQSAALHTLLATLEAM